MDDRDNTIHHHHIDRPVWIVSRLSNHRHLVIYQSPLLTTLEYAVYNSSCIHPPPPPHVAWAITQYSHQVIMHETI
jgi:hypothetical protein